MASEQDVRAQLQRAGQDHLLRFWADLAPESRAALLAELASLKPDALREHCQRASAACAQVPGPLPDLEARLQPLPPELVGSAIRCDLETRLRWEEEGRQRRTGRGLGRRCPSCPEELEECLRGRGGWRFRKCCVELFSLHVLPPALSRPRSRAVSGSGVAL